MAGRLSRFIVIIALDDLIGISGQHGELERRSYQ